MLTWQNLASPMQGQLAAGIRPGFRDCTLGLLDGDRKALHQERSAVLDEAQGCSACQARVFG